MMISVEGIAFTLPFPNHRPVALRSLGHLDSALFNLFYPRHIICGKLLVYFNFIDQLSVIREFSTAH